jgi:hypothetical protein
MISREWAEELTKALPRRAEYWPDDVIERNTGGCYEVIDIAYAPMTGTFLYKIEPVDANRSRSEWVTSNELTGRIVEKTDRPEPLAVDRSYDPEEIDDIEKKLQSFKKAQQRAAEESSTQPGE